MLRTGSHVRRTTSPTFPQCAMSAADDGLHLTKRLDEISQNGALHGRLTHHADPAVENDIESQYDSDWELQQAENAAQR